VLDMYLSTRLLDRDMNSLPTTKLDMYLSTQLLDIDIHNIFLCRIIQEDDPTFPLIIRHPPPGLFMVGGDGGGY